jgi:hypothetical protein
MVIEKDRTMTENKLYETEKARADKVRAAGLEKSSKGKPTPTQEENDRAACGEYIAEHQDDGSGPDIGSPEHPLHPEHAEHKRQATAAPSSGAAYQTRGGKPAT